MHEPAAALQFWTIFLLNGGVGILLVIINRKLRSGDKIIERLECIDKRLQQMNGSVREIKTWKEEHEKTHNGLEHKVADIDHRCWQFHRENEP